MPGTVTVTDLTKSYGAVQAVRGISFSVAAGEVFGMLGPNGAGKTTTIECLIGLRDPDHATRARSRSASASSSRPPRCRTS